MSAARQALQRYVLSPSTPGGLLDLASVMPHPAAPVRTKAVKVIDLTAPKGRLSKAQIRAVWVAEGGPPRAASAMARIAIRESGGKSKINNAGTNQNGTVDHGLYQVNDVWRKDPVIGKLFKSGAIYTPEGGTQAAIRILKVQGPQAWASGNAAIDAKYLKGLR